jgi:hypothetical protein
MATKQVKNIYQIKISLIGAKPPIWRTVLVPSNLKLAAFHYEYDFGDSWEHKILLEKILPFDTKTALPVCIKGKRACPPEDCGGIWGYEELLEAISNPKHPDHENMLEWLGGEFDPEEFDLEEINGNLAEYCR